MTRAHGIFHVDFNVRKAQLMSNLFRVSVDITVVYLQKPIKMFCFKHKQVKDALKKFDCVLFGFFSRLN